MVSKEEEGRDFGLETISGNNWSRLSNVIAYPFSWLTDAIMIKPYYLLQSLRKQ